MTQKSMKRALRRHHVARLKNTRRFRWGRDLAQDPKALARLINTPTPCSCHMCGNDRKYLGERTIQEQRQLQAWSDIE